MGKVTKCNIDTSVFLEIKKKHIPRSYTYKDKQIDSVGFVTIRETRYFKRVFSDGSTELTRYDEKGKKWVHLCFLP
jgi:hypothetical protein